MKHLPRVAQLALAALAGALLAGAGYAVASSGPKPIRGCIENKTRLLHVTNGRCKRGQSRIDWNRQGPQGPRGAQGAQGPQGPLAASAWATIGTSGAGVTVSGRNITAARDSVGVYTVTAGGPCASIDGAVNVTPENGPVLTAGHFPQAVIVRESGRFSTFDVHIFDVSGGTLTPEDGLLLDVSVSCQ
jgi:hypothetical protein